MAHSGDWGRYGFLQLGDYESARERIRLFEELAAVTTHRRLASVVALTRARYVIETEEWQVTPVADETELAALVAESRGDTAEAIRLLQEAVGIEESMRPPAARTSRPSAGRRCDRSGRAGPSTRRRWRVRSELQIVAHVISPAPASTYTVTAYTICTMKRGDGPPHDENLLTPPDHRR